MSSNEVVTIKEQYDGVVTRLDAMATEPGLLATRPADCIFLDDMLLRLKLWAVDVQYDQGSFVWAEKMTHVSVPLRERIQDLEQQCGLFQAASKQQSIGETMNPESTDPAAGPSASPEDIMAPAKRDLRQAIENLVAFTTPIKVAASVPEAGRTAETISRANQQAARTTQAALGCQSQYTLLAKPLPADQIDLLLGAVIVPEELVGAGDGPEKPSVVRISRDSARARVEQSTMENFSTGARRNRLTETSAPSTRPCTDLRGGTGLPRTTSYGSTIVSKWQLSNADEYFESFMQRNRADLKKLFAQSPDANLALVSVLLTVRMSDLRSPPDPSEAGQPASPASASGAVDVVDHLSNDVEQVFAFGCLKISAGNFGGPKLSKEVGGLRVVYHLVPSFDLAPPPGGRLDLGSVLSGIDHAERPINGRKLVPVPPGERRVQSVTQATFIRSKEKNLHAGLFTKFTNLVSLGYELTSDRSEETAFKFDRLETVSFTPTASYIEQVVAQEQVSAYLNTSRYKATCYLVTGLKVVRGAAVIQNRTKVTVSAPIQSALGLPATVGVESTATHETTNSTAFDGSNDFIFAIRVSKISFKKSGWLGRRSTKPVVEEYSKGAIL